MNAHDVLEDLFRFFMFLLSLDNVAEDLLLLVILCLVGKLGSDGS